MTMIQAQSASATLIIDLTKPDHAISPMLYNGMLFEEISYGVDGGFFIYIALTGHKQCN